MTQKEFAKHLLVKVLGVSETYVRIDDTVFLFSDRHKDGTKVLRIKCYHNPTNYSIEECDMRVRNYLAEVAGIKKAEVRDSKDSYYIDFVIQVEYVDKLPDLNNPQLIEESVPEEESQVAIKTNPDGSGTIMTEFGMGYFENEKDKKKMLLWLEGVKAGIAYAKTATPVVYPESEEVDPEAEFKEELDNIDADSGYHWWTSAQEIADDYDLDESIKDHIMREAFEKWCNKD